MENAIVATNYTFTTEQNYKKILYIHKTRPLFLFECFVVSNATTQTWGGRETGGGAGGNG